MRTEPLKILLELLPHGDLSYFRLGPISVYVPNSPELVRDVLITHAKSYRKVERILRALRQIDGNGLALSEGDFWRRQRRMMQPLFAQKRMAGYAQSMVALIRAEAERWPLGTPVDIAALMTQLTLKIIGKTMFGIDLDAEQASSLGAAVYTLSESLTREAGSLVQIPGWIPTPGNRRKQRAIDTLDRFIRAAIRERRATREDKGDLLSMLLLALDDEGDQSGMTDEQARDEAVTMFNAGHDSTAAGLAWTWVAATEPTDVQARLAAEAQQVLGSRAATFEDLPRLAYTARVVQETLRRDPPVWAIFAREAIHNTELGGYVIPRGAWVYIFPYLLHHNPKFFPNPETFDPDRFSPERKEQIPQHAYLPFGAGPHVCIGNQFALMEMTLIVATVMQGWTVERAPQQGPVEPEPLLSLRPKGGLQVILRRRENSP